MSAAFGYGYTDAPYLIRGIREISDLLLSINSAVNFFIYFSLNKVFRHNFARVFCRNYYWQHIALKEDGITWLVVKTESVDLDGDRDQDGETSAMSISEI